MNNNNKKSFISTLQYKNVVNEETFLEYQKNYHNNLSHLYFQTYKRRNTFCLVPKTTKANYTYSQNVLKANKKKKKKQKEKNKNCDMYNFTQILKLKKHI